MIRVLELPLSENVEPLYRFLQAQGLRIWVIEEKGRQVILADTPEHAALIRVAYEDYRQSPLLRESTSELAKRLRQSRQKTSHWWETLALYPMVSLLLLSLTVAALWTGFGEFDGVKDFLVMDRFQFAISFRGNTLAALWAVVTTRDWLRLLLPAWLHWSLLHWLFNSLGLWIFGRSLEQFLGSLHLLGLVLVSAVLANIGQFLMSGPDFGGFSGVVFALVGAHAAGLILRPKLPIWANTGLVSVSVVWMLAALTGVTEWFGVYVANTAHLVGFFCGLVWVWTYVKLKPNLQRRPAED